MFVDEQQVPIEEEIDDLDLDPSTLHVLAVEDGAELGYEVVDGRSYCDAGIPHQEMKLSVEISR